MNKKEKQNTNWFHALGSLIGAGALLGLTTNLAKVAGSQNISALAFLAWSIAGATIILFIIAAARRQLPPLNLRALEYYVIAALVTVAGSNLIFFSAIPHVGASLVALAMTLPPLLTYLGALLFRIERFQTLRAVGVSFALAGAAFLAIKKISTPDAPTFWILLTLVGPMLLAIGNLYRTLRWPPGASAESLAPGMLAAATVMLFLTGSVPTMSLEIVTGDTKLYLLVAIQSCLFAGQFLLMFLLQKSGGPVLLSLLGAIAAIVGVPVAILLLGEPLPEGLFISATLIAIGIILVTLGGIKNNQTK